ncbi:hypothetical protein WFZ85_10445 [Flavobacterium sp. j3]|uniref:Uncharacterized protein n=1 Tax=Flavobacterium aureirubrum TaxID=3133147 RepID=A0ABU9N6H6_9FLAO
MKKLFFIALVIMAFSSVSMANNTVKLDEKEVKTTNLTKTDVNVVSVNSENLTCHQLAAKALVSAVLADIPVDGAFIIAKIVYAFCVFGPISTY